LSALDGEAWILAGVVLHGASFTLVFITAQIYVDQRVDTGWRARAQALLSLVNGVGNLLGYLGTGAWFAACTQAGGTHWSRFWFGLAAAVAGVAIYFLFAYRGRGTPPAREPSAVP